LCTSSRTPMLFLKSGRSVCSEILSVSSWLASSPGHLVAHLVGYIRDK
jgi:hypothetical protein